MQLNGFSKNAIEMVLGEGKDQLRILFGKGDPVAVQQGNAKPMVTKEATSATVSKYVNEWLDSLGASTVERVEQEKIDALVPEFE